MKIELEKDEIGVLLDSLQLLSKKDENNLEKVNKISVNRVYNKLVSYKELE